MSGVEYDTYFDLYLCFPLNAGEGHLQLLIVTIVLVETSHFCPFCRICLAVITG